MLTDYLTTSETAKLTDLHPAYVARLCARGILQAVKIGSQWFIPREALDDPAFTDRRPGRPSKTDSVGKEQTE